ncbi:replication protein A 70 kDa DNA-binding subunit B [Tanacetum coccineum]|uniref:Replication protein A 70 kDa DNA-binding subunit B n=1 Tax=Tanacetum coccineum TaxID=301880 RepID=A0ABQ4YYF9_9ASTR
MLASKSPIYKMLASESPIYNVMILIHFVWRFFLLCLQKTDQILDQNLTLLGDTDPMIDDLKVLGRCVSLWKSHPVGRPNKVWALDMVFQDAQAKKFDNLYEQRESLGHVVMILQLAKVKYFNEKPYVANAIFSTKLFINDDIPKVAAFRQRYAIVEGYDPKQKIISVFSPVKRELTPKEFFQGVIKKRLARYGFHCILYARIHKLHREHGWAYLACKKCGRIVKEAEVGMKYKVIIRVIDDTGSVSLFLFDDLVFQLSGVKCYTLLNQHGFDYDDYFPSELNNMGAGGDVQTPLLKSGSSSKFSSSDVVPFSIEETPKSKGVASSEGESSSSGSEKRAIIDLDDYNEEEEQAKKGKMIVKVKTEPEE